MPFTTRRFPCHVNPAWLFRFRKKRNGSRAAFPRSTLCLQIADALGPVYEDESFADLFPRRGQPAQAPGQLAWVTVLPFVENLSERAAVQQERETETLIAALLGIFEPMLILVMGGVMLIIVLAILLPIFDLNQLVH